LRLRLRLLCCCYGGRCGRRAIAITVIEDFASAEFFYESLFACVELVGDALRERDEFDEEEVEAGDVEFGVYDIVFGYA
ncbi:UNVERIFIED_CONTAM: hypothetical protein NY603_36450, partial [Bacteroidetes bacterium 56_B9]